MMEMSSGLRKWTFCRSDTGKVSKIITGKTAGDSPHGEGKPKT
jgi:hypothetical protein